MFNTKQRFLEQDFFLEYSMQRTSLLHTKFCMQKIVQNIGRAENCEKIVEIFRKSVQKFAKKIFKCIFSLVVLKE